IDPDRPLNEVGLDSLRSVTLANSLEDDFGTPVSVAELIRGPTINELVDHLVDKLPGFVSDEPAETDAAMTSTVAVRTMAIDPSVTVADVHSRLAPSASRGNRAGRADVGTPASLPVGEVAVRAIG